MGKTRRNHPPAFKAKAAVEALRGHQTIQEIAAHHQVHPNQAAQWRCQVIDQAAEVFAHNKPARGGSESDLEVLLAKIGELTVEKDFLLRVLGK